MTMIESLINGASEYVPPPPDPKKEIVTEGERPKESQATRLVGMATAAEAKPVHDAQGKAYLLVDGEVHPLKGGAARVWLAQSYWKITNSAPSAQALSDAIGVLTGKATFEGDEIAVAVRVAGHDDAIYLDLADADRRVVRISSTGWEVIKAADAPVHFRRPPGVRPLPVPTVADLGLLRTYINVKNDVDFYLLVTWMVAGLCPNGPFPVLVLKGEQGSAKSTTARVIRRAIDPAVADIRTPAREVRDLAIAANNTHILAYDNISSITPWLSDAFCRLATGGATTTRTLYADEDETIFEATRPVILTAIDEVVTRGDLADRELALELPRITETSRRTERDLWRDFDGDAPHILAALLDLLVVALRDGPHVQLPKQPRMADFAAIGAAIAPVLGWTAKDFITAYDSKRDDGRGAVIDSEPFAVALGEWLTAEGWMGSAGELLDALQHHAQLERLPRTWPQSPQSVGSLLRRLAPDLRARGIDVEQLPRAKGGGRRWEITDNRENRETHVTHVTHVETNLRSGDIRGDIASTEAPRLSPDPPDSEPTGDMGDMGDNLLPYSSDDDSDREAAEAGGRFSL